MKFLKIIGIILVVVGAAFANFTDVAIADYTALAVSAIGFGMTVIATWKKSSKKDWKFYVALVSITLGALFCGLAGIADSKVTQLISAVAGIIILICGLITSLVTSKESESA